MTGDARRPGARWREVLKLVAAWALVGVPLLWGVLQTIAKAALLFD